MIKYKAILTTAGAAKIAAASAGGKPLKIDRLAVGDGNGKLPTPSPAQTKLINERYRAALNSLTVDKAAPDRLIAELIIPASVGGFWLREMGLYDADGVLIAVSNMAESYKPKLEEGSGRTQTLRMVLIVSHTEAITLIVSGDMVTATRDFVTAAIDDHAKSRNHPDATTAAKGFVQLSSVTNSASETLAATPKAVKAVNDAAVKLAQNLADLPDKAKARTSLGLGSAATKHAGKEVGQVMINGDFGVGGATSILSTVDTLTLVKSLKTGKYAVNSGSTDMPVKDIAYCLDWTLTSTSSGGHGVLIATGLITAPSTWDRVYRNTLRNGVWQGWVVLYDTENKPTAADIGALTDAQALQKYALRSIKVNGKPLSADVNLLAGDVNAWNKTEADGRYLMLSGGTVKSLTVKTGSTGTNNTALLIDGVEHTPLVLKRSSATANLSIGFQLGGNAPLYRLGIDDKNNLCWGADANQAVNATIYHTKNKPTAADVGALTDAQALQKYALRSIKVNGKPLSADVNLVAADINAWNKTESDSRYLMKSGGQLTGVVKTSAEIQSMSSDNYRLIGGDYGTYWRNDGNSLYLLMTNAKNQYGAYNGLRPLAVNVKNGDVVLGHNASVSGNLKVGQATHSADGNILGSRWGNKWLWDAVIEQVNGRVDWNSFNNRTHVAGDRNAWWYKDELTGFIIQGGVVNRVDYANWVGFPRGYARQCFGVQLTLISSTGTWFGDSRVNIQARDMDNNGFNAMMDGQEQVVFWQSVGV
ncbi:phage tail-collar fiber domain-containing protein [Serratia fonticola]|uniref:Phage tail protein n=1 Tax=Serratia fonticola TaxID=47917 RepID=A0AAE7STZ1_SERFO|nr:phage tail protein [Serratia fonticola]QXT42556.1 phage tail protein [Serratia fonticola]